MCPFLESVLVVDGEAMNLAGHAARMARTRAAAYPDAGGGDPVGRALDDLRSVLEPLLPGAPRGRAKARIPYGAGVGPGDIAPYVPRPLASALVVDVGSWRYPFKRTDRRELDAFAGMAKAAGADDALLVAGGLATDFTFANAAFQDEGGRWLTPRRPLLMGTRRELLLRSGELEEADIRIDRLAGFVRVAAINALIDLGERAFTVDAVLSGVNPA